MKIQQKSQSNKRELSLYCDSLEQQFEQAKKDGVFEILKILELDEEHSDNDLVLAVKHYNDKNGAVEINAPDGFLTEAEREIVYRHGSFRPDLYCMLLSVRFSDAIENKTAFIKHSYKYAFDS